MTKPDTPLKPFHTSGILEAGCDEAGRGCLAGPVFAAAVILPPGFENGLLNDSKQLTARQRAELREIIEGTALAWSVASVSPSEIDSLNILNASFLAMHRAVEGLKVMPEALLIDGNRFKPCGSIPHHCIVKGDGIYLSIAAASVLAKTWRDEHMMKLHEEFPAYGWNRNKGYGTDHHYNAIRANGICRHHRKSFNLGFQLEFAFPV